MWRWKSCSLFGSDIKMWRGFIWIWRAIYILLFFIYFLLFYIFIFLFLHLIYPSVAIKIIIIQEYTHLWMIWIHNRHICIKNSSSGWVCFPAVRVRFTCTCKMQHFTLHHLFVKTVLLRRCVILINSSEKSNWISGVTRISSLKWNTQEDINWAWWPLTKNLAINRRLKICAENVRHYVIRASCLLLRFTGVAQWVRSLAYHQYGVGSRSAL